jgi:hypothetical protein
VAQLYPQALGSLFVASYDSLGNGGGILTRLHIGMWYNMFKKNPWPESASELYPPSDRRLSAKLVPTFADRGCHVVSVTEPYGRILGFLD